MVGMVDQFGIVIRMNRCSLVVLLSVVDVVVCVLGQLLESSAKVEMELVVVVVLLGSWMGRLSLCLKHMVVRSELSRPSYGEFLVR